MQLRLPSLLFPGRHRTMSERTVRLERKYPRCEYADGRGQCRSDGKIDVFPYVMPQKGRGFGFLWASTMSRASCAKHVPALAAFGSGEGDTT